MNIKQAKEIILKQVYDVLRMNDHFLSGDKDTRFEAFESVVGTSIYNFSQEEVDRLHTMNEDAINNEYERLCKVGEENRLFYNKMIQYLENL